MECSIHHKSVPDDDKLQNLSTLASWETILASAKSKNYQSILQLAENVADGEFPPVKYHKRCRNLFV